MIKGWTLKSSRKSFLQILELMSDVSVTRGRSYWNIRPRIFDFFFYQGFLSRTLTTHRTAGKRREPSFCSLYHFHPLPNIQTLTLHMRWFLTYIFNRNALYLSDWYSMRFNNLPTFWLTDLMLIFVCLFDDLILGFCCSSLTREID